MYKHLCDMALNFDVAFCCQSVYIDDTGDGQTQRRHSTNIKAPRAYG